MGASFTPRSKGRDVMRPDHFTSVSGFFYGRSPTFLAPGGFLDRTRRDSLCPGPASAFPPFRCCDRCARRARQDDPRLCATLCPCQVLPLSRQIAGPLAREGNPGIRSGPLRLPIRSIQSGITLKLLLTRSAFEFLVRNGSQRRFGLRLGAW